MSLFTEPVDRFYVGKMISGLLFIGSFLKLLRVSLSPLLPAGASQWSFANGLLAYGLSCLLWFGVYRVVEWRRQASAARREVRAT